VKTNGGNVRCVGWVKWEQVRIVEVLGEAGSRTSILTPLHPSNIATEMVDSFYDLAPTDGKGQEFPFSQLKGKVVLIVNVASQCGFTKQYSALQSLYDKFKDRGLEIIGFPCNQFGAQEPGSDSEIAQFCSLNFGVNFPIMKKTEVNGSDADPVYKFLKSKKAGILGFSGIKWNFEKFLIDRNGNVTNRWPSTTTPQALEGVIARSLEE